MSDQQRLDLGLLERALAQLKRALADYATHPETEAYRDSVVMRFVFTYELCMQVILRFVQLEHPKPVPESELTTPRLIRRANALGILQDEWEQFSTYRNARNTVAHAYDQVKAQRVADLAPRFAAQAQYLLDKVREKLND